MNLLRCNSNLPSLFRQHVLRTNRGNDLLLSLLKTRYPCLVKPNQSTIESLVSALSKPLVSKNMDEQHLLHVEHVRAHGPEFPSSMGDLYSQEEKIDMLLYLVSTGCYKILLEL